MNKTRPYYLYILLGALMLVFSGCTGKNDSAAHAAHEHATAEEYYTCPMHPNVRSDRPGACPVCNMALVKVSGNQDGRDGFRLSPQQRQLANIEVMQVGTRAGNTPGTAAILTGEIVLNENAIETITARVPGRIDKLYIRNTGEQIKKGQPLYQIYSEQLVAAQHEYLLALKQEGINLSDIRRELASAARQKLLLWGMTEAQIKQLVRSGKPEAKLTYFSPAAGTVTEIAAREGAYVQEGSSIMRVADLNAVWVQAQVYPQELQVLSNNPKVKVVTEAAPTDTLEATLVLNSPALEQDRQLNLATFRIENQKGKLKPGMLAYVLVSGDKLESSAVVVPRSAVLPGEMPMIWVEMPDSTFESRMVKLGAETNDRVQVLSGVNAGERVVVRGTYLLNSEFILRNGEQALHQH